jgi:PAS domain S-box-containing protein
MKITMTNQMTLKNMAARYWLRISDWFTNTRYFNEEPIVSKLRYFQIKSFSFLFIATLLNFIGNLGFNFVITSFTCLGLIVVRYLIDKYKVKKAYLLMLCSINLSLILLTYLSGLRSGVFLFFFPSIISFSFLTDLTNKKNVALTYLVGGGSFLISIIIAPDSFFLNGLTIEITKGNFFINIILSFALIVWMSFSLAKENYRKQTILRNKEVFLDTIFNTSLHAEIIVDLENGLISSFNNHANSLFAVDGKETLHNKLVIDLFNVNKENENEEFLSEINKPECNWEGEQICVRMDGSDFPASVSIVSFQYHAKYFKKITIVDITEKNQILFELQVAKKKAEESAMTKSQFLSHMSHELRTPLNGIIGSTNLLLQDEFLPAQKDQLSILKYSSEHMLNLINDVLDLSKLEADRIQFEKAEVEIPELIHKISTPFVPQYERKGVAFEVEIDTRLNTSFIADPTRLNQVLSNLLSNALKFTSSGTVKLEVKANSIRSDYHSIEFSVKDSGIGISRDKVDHIFEQFAQADVKTTRKYGGTGLGLSISRKLVRLMGGELKVESKINEGSRFYFEVKLPVHYSQKKLTIKDAEKATDDKKLNGFRVLIAEDNPINMKIASRFLDKWGIVYEKAINGVEAVSLFEKNKFDMVLMDLEMPEMDGYGALSAIRGMNSTIPAIAFTAAVFDNMKESLINRGFNDFIQKPFRPQDLQAKLVAISAAIVKKSA